MRHRRGYLLRSALCLANAFRLSPLVWRVYPRRTYPTHFTHPLFPFRVLPWYALEYPVLFVRCTRDTWIGGWRCRGLVGRLG